jgi:hypothetical protein
VTTRRAKVGAKAPKKDVARTASAGKGGRVKSGKGGKGRKGKGGDEEEEEEAPPTVHPLLQATRRRGELLYVPGNFTLANLNLAHNQISSIGACTIALHLL